MLYFLKKCCSLNSREYLLFYSTWDKEKEKNGKENERKKQQILNLPEAYFPGVLVLQFSDIITDK